MDTELASRYHAMIARLESQGFERLKIDGHLVLSRVTGARLLRSHTAIAMSYEPRKATGAVFEEQAHRLLTWHANKYPNPRLRPGLGAFSVMFAETADESALESARGPFRKGYGLMCTRALIHGPNSEVEYFQGRQITGFAVAKGLRDQLLEFVGENHSG